MKSPEEYYAEHQKAFRTAFDFLNKHFPPEDSPEWWQQAIKDASDMALLAGEGKLVNGLVVAVYDYLEDDLLKRREQDGTQN